MLRVLAALTKDLGLDLSIHNGRLTTAYHSDSRGSDIIFWQKRRVNPVINSTGRE